MEGSVEWYAQNNFNINLSFGFGKFDIVIIAVKGSIRNISMFVYLYICMYVFCKCQDHRC